MTDAAPDAGVLVDPRRRLTGLNRLLLDLTVVTTRWEHVDDEDADQENTAVQETFTECAEQIVEVTQKYLNPDGTVPGHGKPHRQAVLAGLEAVMDATEAAWTGEGVPQESAYHHDILAELAAK